MTTNGFSSCSTDAEPNNCSTSLIVDKRSTRFISIGSQINISSCLDVNLSDKKSPVNSSSKHNRTFVVILIILITMVISFFCYYNRTGRRQRSPSLSLNETIEQSQQEPTLLDLYRSQSPRLASTPSRSQLYADTMRRWKNFRHGLPTYSSTRTSMPVSMPPETLISNDHPPAYEGKSCLSLIYSDHELIGPLNISDRFVSERHFTGKYLH
jgi:hypothetical protein